ncbi:helix-turn-helix domain-containing protein [Arthrospiribacter ruber]|uniref:DNA-binding protein n=1 Tax=Arthrospiribacter ruber TaxID=2487934 RepID=A0A951MDB2_9BACT|nr:helix-turn-helix domain-containing protein [Arthrospiribacter ruber]MBW3470381.1 DNA-binding protein [Arthrospiribacter ruber]
MASFDFITKEDLEMLRVQLMNDFRKLIEPKKKVLKEWIKGNEVRKILSISPGSLQNLRINGLLNPKKIGGTWYYRTEEIEALFEK